MDGSAEGGVGGSRDSKEKGMRTGTPLPEGRWKGKCGEQGGEIAQAETLGQGTRLRRCHPLVDPC
jgi:hypothetical protein